MGYPIFHSQYTAAQIEASIGKTPRIKASTRTWEVWDIATSAYVNTGVSIDTELFVDPTLTESGYAADAKVVGNAFANSVTSRGELTSDDTISSIHSPGMWYVNDSLPSDWPLTRGGRLVMFGSNSSVIAQKVQLIFPRYGGNMVYRIGTGSGWTDWIETASVSSVNALSNLLGAEMKTALLNLMDPVYELGTFEDHTNRGRTYTWNTDKTAVHVSGTGTSSNSFLNVFAFQNALPAYIQPDSYITIQCTGMSAGLFLRVYLYPNTLPNRSFEIYEDTTIYIPAACTGLLARVEIPPSTSLPESGTDVSVEILNGITSDQTAMRLDAIEGKLGFHELKLLVYGSSFSYSTLGLVPEIIKEIAPDLRFVLGICYQSGAKMQDHITNWGANTAYPVYSEYDSEVGKWVNLTSTVTGKQAAMRFTWDYVVLQQASRYAVGDENYAALETFADMVAQYVSHPVSFGYNLIQSLNETASFPSRYDQPTGREKSNAMFADMAAYAQRALNDKIVSWVIPGGTAVQNARTTTLDALGTVGDLSDDNNGHLQNGIPTLIPAYAAAYKICEIAGVKPKMFAIPLSPTDSWLAEYNLYTRTVHGSCVGVTDANKLIAQKCAMMAVKHPFEISDMSAY